MAETYPNGQKTLGKGENAHYNWLLLFPQCFQNTCTADKKKPGFVWERINFLTSLLCKILDWTKLRAFAMDILNVAKIMFSVFEWVENNVEKGKMLITDLHNVWKRSHCQGHSNSGLFGKGLTLSQTSPGFYMSVAQGFWKHWEKEKLLVTSNFSFSHSVFYTFCNFHRLWNCRLQTVSVWQSQRFVVWERVIELIFISLQVIVSVGWILNSPMYHGVVFQLAIDVIRNKKPVAEMLAAGGRYDHLVI